MNTYTFAFTESAQQELLDITDYIIAKDIYI